MGYRHYFYEVKKPLVEEIKKCKTNKEYIELLEKNGYKIKMYQDEMPYFSPYDLGESIFEFGKLYFDDLAEKIAEKGNKLFTSEELENIYSDYNVFVCGKESVKVAIESYKQKIIKSIEQDITEPSEEEKDKKVLMPDKIFKAFISSALPYKDTRAAGDKCKETLTDELRWIEYIGEGDYKYSLSSSWLYKHSIFTLIAILKFLDFENNCILFMGW